MVVTKEIDCLITKIADNTKRKSNSIINAPCGINNNLQIVTIYSKHIDKKVVK